MSFLSLGLNPELLKAVAEEGYSEATPIQVKAIPLILDQQDVMAGAQTGTGKTAAFALPILQKLCIDESQSSENRNIRALVLVPTRELAQQVHKNFERYAQYTPLNIALVYGGVSLNTQIETLKKSIDVVVATPGRLLDLLFKQALDLSSVEFVVFDEADRMLDMGFIDDINKILAYTPDQRQTLLFSATFDSAIFDLSKTMLNKPTLIEVDARNTTASKVEQMVYAVDEDRKRELISHTIGAKNWQQVLIFTRTKKGADLLAKEMCKDGLKTQAIHGDKSQGARERALEDFREGTIRALVATDVAARGLDIPQLEYVINHELPYNAEDYIHRIGRTGRAGNKGLAISLLSPAEEYLLEEIEAILDTKLPQQWLPGYEPDLNKSSPNPRKNSRAAQNKRAKERAYGSKPKNSRRR
jgi:superfamily II DNA/RNA helicase